MVEGKLQLLLKKVSTENMGNNFSCLLFLFRVHVKARGYHLSPKNVLFYHCSSKLKEHMKYCVEHPEEISKLAKVKAQVSEVKGVMMENIEKVKRFSFSPFSFLLFSLLQCIKFN